MRTDEVYQRYMSALERVSGGGVWYDTGAVRLAFQLGLDDAYAAGSERVLLLQAERSREYSQQFDRLAEYLVAQGHDADALLDCAPAQIVDRIIGVIANLVLVNSRPQADAGLSTWLGTNLDVVVDGETPVEQTIAALDYYHAKCAALEAANASLSASRVAALTEASHLRQQRAEQGLRLEAMENETRSLRDELSKLQRSEAAANPSGDGPGAAGVHHTNGNGKRSTGRRYSIDNDALRERACALIRQLQAQRNGLPPKIQDFDAQRTDDLPSAGAIMLRLKIGNWMQLVHLANEQAAAEPVAA